MFFSSIPSTLDPFNWQQSQNQQIIGNSNGGGGPAHLLSPPKPVLPHGLIRAGSMADRARMANIPMPEAALKCPRCESFNTKFCYFNNYNLSQPRHFCKTCRRYWTRGGALRSVPIGGGCRRNKRSSKSSSSKTAATSAVDPTRQTNTNNNNNNNNNNNKSDHISSSTMISNTSPINGLGPGPIGFMPSLPHLAQNFGHHQNMGLVGSYPGPAETGFQGTAGLLGGPILLSGPNSETWRLMQQVQNFPLLGGSEQPYQFQGGDDQQILMGGGGCAGHHQGLRPKFSSSMLAKLVVGNVKMEESPPELSQSRRLLGGSLAAGNEQWSWTELSGFSSSDPPQATLCKEK